MKQSEKNNHIVAIIPTKNRRADLIRCVHSVLAQRRKPDELIIVDQSDDQHIMEEVKQVWYASEPGIKLNYVYDPTVSGLVQAKQRGVVESTADIVMFLEDDVILEPDYLAVLESGFVKYPEMYGSCGVVKDVPEQGYIRSMAFRLFHRGIFADPRVDIHGQSAQFDGRMIPSTYISGGLSAYRREVFEKVPFDTENGFFMVEDIDFSTRAAGVFGTDAFYINTGAVLEHLMSPVNRDVLEAKFEKKLREYTVFYKKKHREPLALLNFIWLVIGLFIEASLYSIRMVRVGPLRGAFRGLTQGVCWRVRPLSSEE